MNERPLTKKEYRTLVELNDAMEPRHLGAGVARYAHPNPVLEARRRELERQFDAYGKEGGR